MSYFYLCKNLKKLSIKMYLCLNQFAIISFLEFALLIYTVVILIVSVSDVIFSILLRYGTNKVTYLKYFGYVDFFYKTKKIMNFFFSFVHSSAYRAACFGAGRR